VGARLLVLVADLGCVVAGHAGPSPGHSCQHTGDHFGRGGRIGDGYYPVSHGHKNEVVSAMAVSVGMAACGLVNANNGGQPGLTATSSGRLSGAMTGTAAGWCVYGRDCSAGTR
jgi:hypothetical protein